jgi:cytochrome b561
MRLPLAAAAAPIEIGHTLPIVLGSLTVLCGLAVFFTCRFMPLLGETWQNRVVKSKIYQRFYKYHAYYWWFFWMLMLLHVFAAVGHTVYSP